MSAETASARRSVLAPAAGFIAWSLVFVALYAVLSVGCRFGWDEIGLFGPVTLQRAVLSALFVAGMALSLFVLQCARARARRAEGDRPRLFLEKAGVLAAVAALAASVVNFAPVFFLSACH